MKLTEHIALLQKLLHEHGDVDVIDMGEDGGHYEAFAPQYHTDLYVWRDDERKYEKISGVLI